MDGFQLKLDAYPSSVRRAREAIAAWAQAVDPSLRADLVLAVSELVTNGIKHGPDGARIRILAVHTAQGGIRVEVRDEGRPQTIPMTPKPGGRGLQILDALADAWGTTSNPTCVWFTLTPRPGPVAHRRVATRQPGHTAAMAEPVPAGSDVSAGTYTCTNCGYRLGVQSTQHLPPCPNCNNGSWQTLTGGDSVNDPYPDR